MAIILIIAGYLVGSIPFGYIAGRVFKGIDIHKAGDGNVGAANVFREISPLAGILVMVADVCKGSAVILLAQAFGSQLTVYLAGLAAVAGHVWPLYVGFKGGRGEATASGVLLVLLPQAILILLAVALVPFLLTRNTMLLGAILFAPLWLLAWISGAAGSLIAYSIGLPVFVGINHLVAMRHVPAGNKKAQLVHALKTLSAPGNPAACDANMITTAQNVTAL